MATVNEKMTAIADAIRSKTGGTEALTLDDMASGVNEVYQSGYQSGSNDAHEKGFEEGKLAERNAFWETFQDGGNRTYYMYTFYGAFWNDDNYNPIYPIKIRTNNTNTFAQCGVTDSKVVIDIGACDLNNTFRNSKFVTMKINIVEGANVKTAFTDMPALKNLTVAGTIGKSFDISDSPLTVESLKSIITALKDNTGASEYSYTLTVKTSAFNKLEAEGSTAEYNGVACTWAELIDNKKWNLVKA